MATFSENHEKSPDNIRLLVLCNSVNYLCIVVYLVTFCVLLRTWLLKEVFPTWFSATSKSNWVLVVSALCAHTRLFVFKLDIKLALLNNLKWHLPLITLVLQVLHIAIHASPLNRVTHSQTAGMASYLHSACPPRILCSVTWQLRQA